MIFLNRDGDIRAWLLANIGKAPLDLLVLESRPDLGEGEAETPEPAAGRYPFFDRQVWEGVMPSPGGDIVGAMEPEHRGDVSWEEESTESSGDEDDDEGDWMQGEPLEGDEGDEDDGDSETPSGRRRIVIQDVSF
jgi:hypothetical protein